MRTPEILVTTNISGLNENVRDFVQAKLNNLDYEGTIKVRDILHPFENLTSEAFRDCSAIILRPTDSLKLTPEHLEHTTDPFFIITVSSGSEQLDKIREHFKNEKKNVEIISCEGICNSPGVAEFNITMANRLFHQTNINETSVANNKFNNKETLQTNLINKTWLLIGCGRQSKWLIPQAFNSGVNELIVWHPGMNQAKFFEVFQYLPKGIIPEFDSTFLSKSWNKDIDMNESKFHEAITNIQKQTPVRESNLLATISSINGENDNTVANNKVTVRGIGQSDYLNYLGEADIVSLLTPVMPEHKGKGYPSTIQIVNEEFIGRMKQGAMLVNTSRGELIVEEDALKALKDGDLGGIAVDVVSIEAEKAGTSELSALWSYFKEMNRGDNPKPKINLIVTPHISGVVDGDQILMWEDTITNLLNRINK